MEAELKRVFAGLVCALLLAGCGSSQNAKELTVELTGAYAAYNEALRTGESTVELMANAKKLQSRLAQLAEEGDPVACVTSAGVRWTDAQVELEAANKDYKAARRHLIATLDYAKCAMAKAEALTDVDKLNMTRWVEGIPDLLKVIDAKIAS